jgi:hypothetical protein
LVWQCEFRWHWFLSLTSLSPTDLSSNESLLARASRTMTSTPLYT